MRYRAHIASPQTLPDMARWVSTELRRIELAIREQAVAALDLDALDTLANYSGAGDYDEGSASTVYGLGTLDLVQ